MKTMSNTTYSNASQKRKFSNLAVAAAFLSGVALSGSANAMDAERGSMWYGDAASDKSMSTALTGSNYDMEAERGVMWYGDESATKPMPLDIVDTAVGAGKFSTLIVAVQEAGLVETLKGEGPFTVFAPTDEAFSKIPADQLQALLADKEALTAVLTYHVVPGKVLAEDVVALNSATTVQGSDIDIDISNGVRVDSANVVATDIVASNGVIHVIDTVIMPQSAAQL